MLLSVSMHIVFICFVIGALVHEIASGGGREQVRRDPLLYVLWIFLFFLFLTLPGFVYFFSSLFMFVLGSLVSPPRKCIVDHIPFPRRWDTVRYSGIQLDTAGYVRMQLDTVGYSGIQWICYKMDRYVYYIESIQGYTGYQGYGEIQAEYR